MELPQQTIAVVLVLGLLALSVVLAQRRGLIRFNLAAGRSRAQRHMELIDRLALTPQHNLHAVRNGDRLLLIATYPGGVAVIEPPALEQTATPLRAYAASAGRQGGDD